MSIEVKLAPILTQFANNRQIADVNGTTVGECLDHLVKQFPHLKQVLFNKKGELQLNIEIYVNQEGAYPMELVKPTTDGDKIHVAMVLAGG